MYGKPHWIHPPKAGIGQVALVPGVAEQRDLSVQGEAEVSRTHPVILTVDSSFCQIAIPVASESPGKPMSVLDVTSMVKADQWKATNCSAYNSPNTNSPREVPPPP